MIWRGYCRENLDHSDKEDAALACGLAFLHQQRYDAQVLALMERRAERGSDAVQLRITLPIVVLTLAATVSNLPVTWRGELMIVVGIVLGTLVLALLTEVGRGNTDVIMLNALDAYRVEQARTQAPPAPPTPEATLHALATLLASFPTPAPAVTPPAAPTMPPAAAPAPTAGNGRATPPQDTP